MTHALVPLPADKVWTNQYPTNSIAYAISENLATFAINYNNQLFHIEFSPTHLKEASETLSIIRSLLTVKSMDYSATLPVLGPSDATIEHVHKIQGKIYGFSSTIQSPLTIPTTYTPTILQQFNNFSSLLTKLWELK